jgi:threonine/homoserine/homoserine lactone efflux protein
MSLLVQAGGIGITTADLRSVEGSNRTRGGNQPMIVSFAFASLVLIALPGPDYALITRNALVGGRSAGIRTALGGATGLTVHAAAAALGMSALLAASAAAYATLKLVGVAYLVYLGLKLLLSARSDEAEKPPARRGHWFAQGLLSSALNVKVALFFLTFLPQFLPDTGSTLPVALGLSAIFAAIYVAWFSGLVVVVGLVSGALRRPRVKAWIERVTGSALVAFGFRLATATRS